MSERRFLPTGDMPQVSDLTALVAARDAAEQGLAEAWALLEDAAVVIERMANGASRAECSPQLDRVIRALRGMPS